MNRSKKSAFSPDGFKIPELGLSGQLGVDYRVRWKAGRFPLLIMAPHGGKIEPGTSQLAEKIAGRDFWFYAFEGIRKRENYRRLHIPSTFFNEPTWKVISRMVYSTVTIHGLNTNEKTIILGGRYKDGCYLVKNVLEEHGFSVTFSSRLDIAGMSKKNVVNINQSGKGIQVEIGRAIRMDEGSCVFREFAKAMVKGLHMLMKLWTAEGIL